MTKPYTLHLGDCIEVLRTLPDNSVDAIVTDPPYGLSAEPDMAEVLRHWLAGDDYQHKGGGFMGKTWDSFVPGPAVWREALRVLKPGGHLLSFFGSRTYDMGTLAIRLAGFEVRDQIMWVYGSGFPKSLDVSKALEAFAKTGRSDSQVTGDGRSRVPGQHFKEFRKGNGPKAEFTPTTDAARQWQGWGTALKPAHEPICVARKPLVGTVAVNVLKFGTGAINVDGCRVGYEDTPNPATNPLYRTQKGYAGTGSDANSSSFSVKPEGAAANANVLGRWPANLIHDGSPEVVALFPDSNGSGPARTLNRGKREDDGWGMQDEPGALRDAGTGSAARFFYCAKASRADRNEGCEHLERKPLHWSSGDANPGSFQSEGTDKSSQNFHPTVKPTDLCAYLCRLVTPPGGLVLDPFMGSGSTGKAAMREGFRFTGIDMTPEYVEIAAARIEHELGKVQAAREEAERAEAERAAEPEQLSLLG